VIANSCRKKDPGALPGVRPGSGLPGPFGRAVDHYEDGDLEPPREPDLDNPTQLAAAGRVADATIPTPRR